MSDSTSDRVVGRSSPGLLTHHNQPCCLQRRHCLPQRDMGASQRARSEQLKNDSVSQAQLKVQSKESCAQQWTGQSGEGS